MRYEAVTVVKKETLCPGHFVLELASSKPLPEIHAGHFLNLRCTPSDPYSLMRPFSILDVDETARTFKVYVKILGRLSNVLSEIHVGTALDCLFPLGNGFEYKDSWKRVALIGGGVGLAPMLFLAQQIEATSKDIIVDGYFGGRTETDLVPMLLEHYGFTMHLATDDGSSGHKGTVVDLFAKSNTSYDVIYTCGPNPMMAALQGNLQADSVAFASLEEYMACGVGACLGCVASITENGIQCNKPVCKDGPVFDLHSVEF